MKLSRTGQAISPGVFSELQKRIDGVVARKGDLVGLHIGDTCLPPPVEASIERLVATSGGDRKLLGAYSTTAGLGTLRAEFAAWLARRGFGNETVDPETEVVLGAGATHALSCALRAIINPGDEVLLAAPYWPVFPGVVHREGAVPVEAPFSSVLYEDPSADPFALLDRYAGSRTRAVYLVSPNNPDGKVLTEAQLLRVLDFAEARDLWVVADEVYADYVYGGPPFVPFARLGGGRAAKRTISAYSLSKSHALAGARIGFVVAPPEVVRIAKRVGTHSVFHPPAAMQKVAIEALREGDAWARDARAHYERARAATLSALEGSGFRFHAPEGGAYVFLDARGLVGGSPSDVGAAPLKRPFATMNHLLEAAIDEGVLLSPGVAFGSDYRDFARLCFTSEELPRVLQGIARLRAAVDRARAQLHELDESFGPTTGA